MIASAYPTLSDFFAGIYLPRRLLGCAAETAEHYRMTIRQFGKFLGKAPTLTDLDEDAISAFLVWFAVGRATATVWGARKHLMALANYAQKKGMLVEVPDVAPVRQTRRAPQAYNAEQIARLVAAARGVEGEISGVPASLFWSALFLVAYDTGARAGAIWSLAWRDYEPPVLLFRAETQKQHEDQILRLSPQTMSALAAIRQPTRRIIFVWPGCRRSKYIRIKAIFAAAGLPSGRRDLLQRIRRTTATLMHRAGGDATAQLGHSDPRITRQHYLDPSMDRQAADLLPRLQLPIADGQRRLF